jgi:hypothetical protein
LFAEIKENFITSLNNAQIVKLLLPSLIFASLLVLVPTNAEAKTYENEKYTFEYPNGCKLEKSENRFSSADASMECKGDAGFLFESGDDESTLTWSDLSDDEMVSNLEETLGNIHYGSNVIESGTDKYMINNQTAPYVIGTYDQEFHNLFGTTKTEEWALMLMLIKLDNGEHVLVQYRNNEDSFDRQLPMAEKIFQSVEGLGNGTAVTETLGDTDTNTNTTTNSDGTAVTETLDDTDTNTNTGTHNSDEFPQTSEYCNTVKTQLGKELCDKLLR